MGRVCKITQLTFSRAGQMFPPEEARGESTVPKGRCSNSGDWSQQTRMNLQPERQGQGQTPT